MVSVIIPSFNRENVIKRSVDSVLAQTYKDFEIIVVDDGSSDNTKKVIEQIQDIRVRYVWQKNAGACAARNHGIDEAKGEYIAFQDSDDVWHPDKLEKQLKALERYHADVVFCKLNQIDNSGSSTKIPADVPEGECAHLNNLLGIGTQSIVGKKEVFKDIRFDPEFPRFQDMELIYRIIQKYKVYCLDDGLVDYYIGSDSISRNYKKLYQACTLLEKKHPELKKDYPIMASDIALSLQLAGNELRKQKSKLFHKYYKMSLTWDDSIKSKTRIMLMNMKLYTPYLKFTKKVK